jgi:hypothetical protein
VPGTAAGYSGAMSPPSWMAYAIVGGVLIVSLIVPLIVGADGWVVPIIVLPFGIAYLVFDRRLKERRPEDREPG